MSTINLDNVTFGVELELTLPRDLNIAVGGYHRGIQFPGLPTGWMATADGSIRAAAGYIACEVVSPVLSGIDGLNQIIVACAKLRELGATVNESCGFHVHIGFDGSNRPALKRLVSLVARNERGIWASTGTKRREHSHFCRGIRGDFRNLDTQRLGGIANDRYHVLNLANIASGSKPTVEFRAFAGTVNASKIIAYVRLCIAMVERAITDQVTARFDSKAGGRFGEQTGVNAVRRMLYEIGWTLGWQDRSFGALGDGIDGIPSIADSKKELRRLAKKYDGAQ